MTKIPALLASSEKPTAAPAGPPASPDGVPSKRFAAVLLGGSEDDRLLLRGLLRLQHHPVLLDAPVREELDRLPLTPEPKILVVTAEAGKDGSWAADLSSVVASRSDLRALVILPSPDPALVARAREAGAKGVLSRPFAIRDFVAALDALEG